MKKTLILLGALTLMASCMSKEEKMKEAEEDGNEAIAVKSKLIMKKRFLLKLFNFTNQT